MKNIHLIKTNKPSRLFLNKVNNKLLLEYFPNSSLKNILPSGTYQHIYITNDEEIKEGDWCLNLKHNRYFQATYSDVNNIYAKNPAYRFDAKKIIITTDTPLIKDGIQAIDDNLLEWLVKNPSCEEVEVKTYCCQEISKDYCDLRCGKQTYKIIIPKEKLIDSIVESVRNDLKQRSEVGIKKYGVTLDRTDLTKEQWLQHAYEEALDLAIYLKKIMTYEK